LGIVGRKINRLSCLCEAANRTERGARDTFVGTDAVQQMCQTAVVIHVQMPQHNPFHIARSDPESPKLRSDLLPTFNPEGDLPSDIGMRRLTGFEKVRTLTCINHDDTAWMLDGPGIGREMACMFMAGPRLSVRLEIGATLICPLKCPVAHNCHSPIGGNCGQTT